MDIDLYGTWRVTEICGEPVLDIAPPAVTFGDDGRISGRATINRIIGSFTIEDGVLTLSPLATTMMAGPPELMDQESRFLNVLSGELQTSTADDGALTLSSGDHWVRLVRGEDNEAA